MNIVIDWELKTDLQIKILELWHFITDECVLTVSILTQPIAYGTRRFNTVFTFPILLSSSEALRDFSEQIFLHEREKRKEFIHHPHDDGDSVWT